MESKRIRVVNGRVANIGLGCRWPLVTLAEARAACQHNARLRLRRVRDPRALAAPAVPTFAEAAETVIALHEPTWKGGARTADIWRASLRDHATPTLGALRLDEIQPRHVIDTLQPIWHDKPATAAKVRQRVASIMRWAIAKGYRPDDPAGPSISAALPKHSAARVVHRKALPYAEVPFALRMVDESTAWPWHQALPAVYRVDRRALALRQGPRSGPKSTWTRQRGQSRPAA